jgi:hypothetical protein
MNFKTIALAVGILVILIVLCNIAGDVMIQLIQLAQGIDLNSRPGG